jgi:Nitrile hydratase beta subunit
MKVPHSYHDMGGEPAGPMQIEEHDYADWERRVDAMCVLLWGLKGGARRMTVDEHRKNIESLPPELYQRMSYYERWVWGLAQCLLQRGIVTTEELAAKLNVPGARSHHDMGGEAAGPAGRSEHDYEEWERRVDAMSVLLSGSVKVDQRRRNIEAIPPAEYDAMAYYDRWVVSLAQSLIQRGLITTEELAKKMAEHGSQV